MPVRLSGLTAYSAISLEFVIRLGVVMATMGVRRLSDPATQKARVAILPAEKTTDWEAPFSFAFIGEFAADKRQDINALVRLCSFFCWSGVALEVNPELMAAKSFP